MKKLLLSLTLVVAALGYSTAQASTSLTPDCPLKVMRKNQTLEDDGTRFIPSSMRVDSASSYDKANAHK